MRRKRNEGCCGRIARIITLNQHISTTILLLLSCVLVSSTIAIPIQVSNNDTLAFNSTEQVNDDSDLLETIQQYERMKTIKPHQNKTLKTIKPRLVSPNEWKQLINKEPLITKLAFGARSYFSPTYAYITSTSYNKYVFELEEKCRRTIDDNIGDTRLENLDNEYFRWEEYQFNKALMHTLFPETIQGDNTRFLKASNVITHIRLGNEMQSQCQIVEHKDNWSETIDEKTQFEDFLINRIFQPRLDDEMSQAIISELEAHRLSVLDDYKHDDIVANSTLSRGKRGVKSRKTKRQMKQEVQRRIRQYKLQQHKRI